MKQTSYQYPIDRVSSEMAAYLESLQEDGGSIRVREQNRQKDFSLKEFNSASLMKGGEFSAASSMDGIAFEYHPDPAFSEATANAIYSIFENSSKLPMQEICAYIGLEPLQMYRFLADISIFEAFLHKNFFGKKRFSVEGCESILLILSVVQRLFFVQSTSLMVGMSHRGRIAAMHTIFQKPLEEIFDELNGESCCDSGQAFPQMGDVLYHKGYCYSARESGLSSTLVSNPSHLESVYPVVLGATRRMQDRFGPKSCAALVMHGDAAIAGQGVVYEALQMQKLDAYKVGGAIHVIIDNLVGFTANPKESRSTARPTDIFQAFSNPVIHIQNTSVIDALRAALIAYRLRQEFGIDVAIRVIGTRRWGHNETDEPIFTQPFLYKKIAKEYVPLHDLFQKAHGDLLSDVACKKIREEIEKELESAYAKSAHRICMPPCTPPQKSAQEKNSAADNADPEQSLKTMLQALPAILTAPNGFSSHDKISSLLDRRLKLIIEQGAAARVDWSFAEMLALIRILQSGHLVRLTGQDSKRGTFSHRHAAIVDQNTESEWIPLQRAGKFFVYNTHLSEYAALAFEYGYSILFDESDAELKSLPIWEAQFGDFINGAQIVIDQYISSGFEKWGMRSNLVLVLPHGYDGHGPDHSSGRMERFLSLATKENMVVACPTFPDTYARLLLEQSCAVEPRPLVIFSPKSKLRDPRATSTVADCFQKAVSPVRIMHQPEKAEEVQAILLSTGGLSIELSDVAGLKNNLKNQKTALISIEILAPFPQKELEDILRNFPRAAKIIWAQEEPENMGALQYISKNIRFSKLFSSLQYTTCSRQESASPATGYHACHEKEKRDLFAAIVEALS